ncbi:hypothetical protein IJ541_02375 [bacterium]|nr:hypothetical protein [bacterium]
MKKIFKFLAILAIFFLSLTSFAQTVLKGSVVKVPDKFFGTWRVVSKCVETDSPIIFKEKGLDLWNISQINDVIKLSNPLTGASAQIRVENVAKDRVEFIKTGKYNNKLLTDKVSISIIEDSFTGYDTLKLETISDIDGSVVKTETAKYSIKGERIAGQSVKGE